MSKQLSIFVAGGFTSLSPGIPKESLVEFACCLAREIVKQGHCLLNGCRNELDIKLAEAAYQQLLNQGVPSPERRIISYVQGDSRAAHNFGTIMLSELSDWDIGGLELKPPEVIRDADVVILMGGCDGLFHAANWANLEQKPRIAFYSFGGAAREAYSVVSRDFEKIYGERVSLSDYDRVVKSYTHDWPQLALNTVALAERIRTSSFVLVIMSFQESADLKLIYETIKGICSEFEYKARRVDESNLLRPIMPEIIRQMRQGAFVIADVTDSRANVFYELGFAHGLGKDTVLLARKGTEENLPFDIKDWPLLTWDIQNLNEFKGKLREHIRAIGIGHGRDELRNGG
ncbi:MAG: hypothetical protein R6W76_19335 [Caldilinea sp.]